MALLIPRVGSAWRRYWLAALTLLTSTACTQHATAQTISRETQLKAVLLYNLTQFVEWPGSAFSGSNAPLVIGILGQDAFGRVLDDTVRGEKYNSRPIVVRRCLKVEEAIGCQILFISSSESAKVPEILPQLKGRAILTVGDFDGFVRAGGMVRFSKSPQDKIRLKINADATKAAELSVSGKLLRVAEIIHPEQD
jgi:hypothetical protein